MAKKNVLVLISDTDGVGYYRSIKPHTTIEDPDYNFDMRLVFDHTLPIMDAKFLSNYQIIVYNKILPVKAEAREHLISMIKHLGIKLVYDIDDYWVLNHTHINYKNWRDSKSQEAIEEAIFTADMVTTTTPLFLDVISKINKNVIVLENAADFNEYQWSQPKKHSDKLRFLWGGGISHMPDIALFKDEFKKFDKEFLEKCQLIMCGFDLRIRTNDGSMAKDDPRRSQWGHFESIFTNSYKYMKNAEYMRFLMEAKQTDKVTYGYRDEYKDEFYQRRYTKPILTYGTMYQEADICLAPLKGEGHQFNYYKSQLKIVEAGIYSCPIICSNYGPYTVDDVEGKVDGIQKGFYIDENKNDWYAKMKWYQQNPSAVKEHGEALNKYVTEKYEMSIVNKKRVDMYNEILSRS